MRKLLTVLALGLGFVVVGAALAVQIPARSATLPMSGWERAQRQVNAMHHQAPVLSGVTASHTAPAGSISSNIQFLANLPLPTAISIAFIGNTAFVSTVSGVYSVDISDPANPRLLSVLPTYIWENEHMTADPSRNLIFISRDPRGFTSPATTAFPYGAVHVIDVSNPLAMVQVGYHQQPTGHTATCIDHCQYLWIQGPASPLVQIPGGADPMWGGRPVWGLDVSNPAAPVDCPGGFIDLNNHNGKTDYDHDVDVDATGVAWVSGSGHIRGYWTSGQHYNYVDGKTETATGCNPIPYAGGDTNEGQILVQGGVMHNSDRNLNLAVDGRAGDLLAATEEVITTDCAQSGRLVTYDLGGTTQAQGWKNSDLTLTKLGQWTPENQPGSTGCDSAHWFTDNGDGLLAQAYYSQGTRLLDIRDPRHIREVGWYNVQDQTGTTTNDTWAAYWHGDNYIFVADFTRGLDVLRYSGTPAVDAPEFGWLPALPISGLVAAGAATAISRRRRRTRRQGDTPAIS